MFFFLFHFAKLFKLFFEHIIGGGFAWAFLGFAAFAVIASVFELLFSAVEGLSYCLINDFAHAVSLFLHHVTPLGLELL
jgi:hypothetical protein